MFCVPWEVPMVEEVRLLETPHFEQDPDHLICGEITLERAKARVGDFKVRYGDKKWKENVAKVAWVGHAPCVGRLVAKAIGDGNASIRMQKGAIASICLDNGLSQPGELQWLVTAQVIEAAV